MRRALAFVLVLAGSSSCATYRDELIRSQHAFEQSDYERTLALLRDLEPDVTRLSHAEQAQYAYLRGMTDYRIGYRADARHWLAIARAHEDASPGTLPVDWKTRAIETLAVLDGVVYDEGYGALSAPPPGKR